MVATTLALLPPPEHDTLSTMNGPHPLFNTARIIFYSLFPPNKKAEVTAPTVTTAVQAPEGYLPVAPADVRYYLADFSRALADNRIALFFTHCYAIAGFFLLLRLKRQGFSSTRAWATDGGLAIEARR